MKLSAEQQETVNTAFKRFRPCEVCGGTQWEGEDVVRELREFRAPTSLVVFPIVAACCKECGNCRFLNATVLGITSAVRT